MPRSKKKDILEEYSSFGSLSSISSESQSSQNYSNDQLPKLSKKDLLELVKLQKQIKQEEEKLKLLPVRSKSSTKKLQKKKDERKKSHKNKTVANTNILNNLLLGMNSETAETNNPPTSFSYRLYVTGFGPQFTYEQLKPEIKSLLMPFKGFCNYKLKMRKGDGAYIIINFEEEDLAQKVLKILKNVKVLGQKLNVTLKKDNLNDEQPKRKCYECQETGHFGRECPIRIERQKNALRFFEQSISGSAQIEPKNVSCKKEEEVDARYEKSQNQQSDYPEKKTNQNKRVTREKSRLQRIIHDNF